MSTMSQKKCRTQSGREALIGDGALIEKKARATLGTYWIQSANSNFYGVGSSERLVL